MTPRRQSRKGTISRDDGFTNKAIIVECSLTKATCPKRLVRLQESSWWGDGIIVVKACVAYACSHSIYPSAVSPSPIVSRRQDELALELENRWTDRPWRWGEYDTPTVAEMQLPESRE